MAKKTGSDGQVRKTTAEWSVDTSTYPEGMRLMNTDTGVVRVSKGGTTGTYAQAWTPSAGSGGVWGDITGTLTNQADLVAALALKAGNVRDYVGGLTVVPGDLIQYLNVLYYSVSATFTTTDWGTDQGNFTAVGVNPAYVAAQIPLRYKWIGDGGAATGTVVANTLGVTINVTNPTNGRYLFTADSGTPFVVGKTTMTVSIDKGGTGGHVDRELTSTSVCKAFTFDISGANEDPVTYQVIIEVEP